MRITEFQETGKVLWDRDFSWNDRLHHRQKGSFTFRDAQAPSVTMVYEGPICSVVRVKGGYGQGETQPDSRPVAVYDWFYFRDLPLAFVRAQVCQENEFA